MDQTYWARLKEYKYTIELVVFNIFSAIKYMKPRNLGSGNVW